MAKHNAKTKLEIERRWVLKCAPYDMIKTVDNNDEILGIFQYYTPKGRFRMSLVLASNTKAIGTVEYVKCVKKAVTYGTASETETVISRNVFDSNFKHATSYIDKIRYKMFRNGHLFEMDTFHFENSYNEKVMTIDHKDIVPSLFILEVELNDIKDKIKMPKALRDVIVCEVTGDFQWSNAMLSTPIKQSTIKAIMGNGTGKKKR